MLTLSYHPQGDDVLLDRRSRDDQGKPHTLSVFDISRDNIEVSNDEDRRTLLRAGHVYFAVSNQSYYQASLIGVSDGKLTSPTMTEELDEALGHLKCLIFTGLINGPLDGTEEDYYD